MLSNFSVGFSSLSIISKLKICQRNVLNSLFSTHKSYAFFLNSSSASIGKNDLTHNLLYFDASLLFKIVQSMPKRSFSFSSSFANEIFKFFLSLKLLIICGIKVRVFIRKIANSGKCIPKFLLNFDGGLGAL